MQVRFYDNRVQSLSKSYKSVTMHFALFISRDQSIRKPCGPVGLNLVNHGLNFIYLNQWKDLLQLSHRIMMDTTYGAS